MAETSEKGRTSPVGTVSGALARVLTAAGGIGGALAILLLLVLVFSLASDNFLRPQNLLNIGRQYAVPLVLAVGQTIVIMSRGIDLSVAATAALSGSVMGVTFAHLGWPEPVALLAGLAAGFAVGAFNGFVITVWKVPDFIATLGTFTGVRGVSLLVTEGQPVPTFTRVVEGRQMPESVTLLGAGTLYGLPIILLVAAVCVGVGAFVLYRTRLGRATYAVGGNPEAARVSGISVERTKFWVYALSGLFAGVGGLLLSGRTGSANALMGDGMELQSIAAVVIGGTNLFGGEGRISGTVIGVLIIGVLSNGLNIMGVADFWQRVVNGLIIVLVVALDQWRRRAAAGAAA